MGLSDRDQAQIVRKHLLALEARRFELEVVQTANGASDDDPVPDSGIVNGEIVSIADRRGELTAAIGRLRDCYAVLLAPSDAGATDRETD